MSFTKYFKSMMLLSIVTMLVAIAAMFYSLVDLSAICLSLTFILWFVGVMAPEEQKYERKFKRNHQ